jgi:hypothetical protein
VRRERLLKGTGFSPYIKQAELVRLWKPLRETIFDRANLDFLPRGTGVLRNRVSFQQTQNDVLPSLRVYHS